MTSFLRLFFFFCLRGSFGIFRSARSGDKIRNSCFFACLSNCLHFHTYRRVPRGNKTKDAGWRVRHACVHMEQTTHLIVNGFLSSSTGLLIRRRLVLSCSAYIIYIIITNQPTAEHSSTSTTRHLKTFIPVSHICISFKCCISSICIIIPVSHTRV